MTTDTMISPADPQPRRAPIRPHARPVARRSRGPGSARVWRFLLALTLAASVTAEASERPQEVLPRRPFFGAQLGPVPAADGPAGAQVLAVFDGHSAAIAGLRAGDVVVGMDGEAVASVEEMLARLRVRRAGDRFALEYLREGQRRTTEVLLREMPRESYPGIEVIYDHLEVDGARRRTILTRPAGVAGRLPTVLLVGGIGCYSVDVPLGEPQPYVRILNELSRRGYATMRVEKTGIGDSEGPPCAMQDFEHELADYVAAARAVHRHPFVDPARVFLFGHSMGGVHAPLIAAAVATDAPLAGIMVKGTVGTSWFAYEMENSRRQAPLTGIPADQLEEQLRLRGLCVGALTAERRPPADILAEHPACADFLQFPAHHSYRQQLVDLDLPGSWRRVRVPVLVIYGTSDFLSSAAEHHFIAGLLNRDTPGLATLRLIEGMDHYFQRATSYEESFRGATQFDERIHDVLSGWMAAVGGIGAPAAGAAEGPSEIRAREIASVLRQWSPRAAADYLAQSYDPALLQQNGAAAPLTFLAQLRDRTGRAEIDALRLLSDGRAEVRLRDPDNEWATVLRVATEAGPPHRITALELGATEPPPHLREPGFSAADAAIASRRLVRSFCERDAFSGAVLLELAGRVVLEEACGEANKDFAVPNDAATRFNVASLGKMFTGVAVARLVQDGLVSFGDSVSRFLPDFPPRSAGVPIRVEHLLTHTSGIGNVYADAFLAGSLLEAGELDARLARAAGDPHMAFAPGTARAYSNTGYLVLGRIVEAASGMRYEDYLARAIFAPAGMTRTCLCSLDRVNPALAVGYVREASPVGMEYRSAYFRENVIQGTAAGGAFSTVGDLLRFGRALRSGGLISPKLVEVVTSGRPELGSVEYGYGFGVLEPGRVVAHSGGTYGATAHMEIGLGGEYTLAVLSNYSGGAAFVLATRLRTIARSAEPGGE